MLVKLGLRAHEVATLTLDDVNWRSGEMLVCAKAPAASADAGRRRGLRGPPARCSPQTDLPSGLVTTQLGLLHDAVGTDSVGTSLRQANRVCTVRALALLRTRFRDSALSPTGHVSELDCPQ
jgi:hypothetical protein